MLDVPALGIGFEQRTDQQHTGPGGPDEAGQRRPHGEKRGVRGRVGRQVALEGNASADHVQGEQQNNKRDVLGQDGVLKNADHLGPAVGKQIVGQRDRAEQRSHHQSVLVALPPVFRCRQQRQDGDRQKQTDEGNDRPHRGHVFMGPVLTCVLAAVTGEKAIHQPSQGDGGQEDRRPLQAAESGRGGLLVCFGHSLDWASPRLPTPGPGQDRPGNPPDDAGHFRSEGPRAINRSGPEQNTNSRTGPRYWQWRYRQPLGST